MRNILGLALILSILSAPVVFAQPKGCPPGLAKKSPPCVPPGLAKKGGQGDRSIQYILGPDGRVYQVGDSLDGFRPIILDARRARRLPQLDDSRVYVELDGKIVEVIKAGNLFVRTVGAISDLLN